MSVAKPRRVRRANCVIVAFVVLCAACSPQAVAPSTTIAPPAPTAATPSPPAADARTESPIPAVDDFVLGYSYSFGMLGDPHADFTLYASGRVITLAYQDQGARLLERRLTAAGIRTVLERVTGTGLFAHSQTYRAAPLPGVQVPGHGGSADVFVMHRDGREILVGADLFDNPQYVRPEPAVKTLHELAGALRSLDAWLPAEAWIDQRGKPYLARLTAVFVFPEPNPGGTPSLDVADVEPIIGGGIESFGTEVRPQARSVGGQPMRWIRCVVLGEAKVADLREVARRSGDAGFYPPGASTFNVTASSKRSGAAYDVLLLALLPDHPVACDPNDAASIAF